MFVNNYQININTLNTGTTATTINLPVSLTFQIVDQEELVQKKFVDIETEKNINPIIDYEKTRFIPLDLNLNELDKIIYQVTFTAGTTYANVGFNDNDIKLKKENFKQTFLNLDFYDSDNPLTQNLITTITLYTRLKSSDLEGFNSPNGYVGRPKPANEIPIEFVSENPTFNQRGNFEGFFIYNYKDILNVGDEVFLYMKATFNNAKTGESTTMMVKQTPQQIDLLIHEQYTKYRLFRTSDGFYYQIINSYQGNDPNNTNPLPNNVTYTTNPILNTATVNLYQILTT
jgi:hypothetical protein